jgi:hypothetical protein
MAKTQARTALVSSAAKAAATATRGRLDCTGVDGGILTFRITNGTAPSVQCEARVMIAHKGSAMPAEAAEGTGDLDWKQVYVIGGGVVASASTRGTYEFGPEVAYLQIEFSTHTGPDVTVEAHATTYTY